MVIKKKYIVILSVFVILTLSHGFNIALDIQSQKRQRSVEDDLINNKECFINIADKLTNYEYPFIYVEKSNIDAKNQTINSMVSSDILNDVNGIKLSSLGYKKISKDHNGIYFYKYKYATKACGIMYYPNGFSETYNSFVVEYEAINNEWYYFEEN